MDNSYEQFEQLFSVPLRNGIFRPSRFRGSGTKMVNMGEIFAHSIIGDIPMDRVKLTPTEQEKCLLDSDDLLFARSSLVLSGAGKCSIFMGASEPVTFESHIIRVRLNKNIAEPWFYYYFFNSPVGRQAIESIVEQVAAAGIRASDLAKIRVPCPPVDNQREIAAILRAFDLKIRINQKLNATLESIAQSLFKLWFIEFEFPDEKDEPYKSSDGEMIDSELGKIQQGWRVIPLSDIVEASREIVNPQQFPNEVFAHFSIPAFDEKKMPTIEKGAMIKSIKLLVPDNCILLSRLNPASRRVWLPSLKSDKRKIASTEFGVLLPKEIISKEFVYCLCSSDFFGTLFSARVTGTSSSHQRVKQEDMLNVKVLLPERKIIEDFTKKLSPLIRLIQLHLQEIETLENIRDMLVSGLLRGSFTVMTLPKENKK